MFFFSSLILLVLYYYDYAKWSKKDDNPVLRIFLCILTSPADAATVNHKIIKTLLANGLITFFISGNPVFSNGPRSLPKILLIVSS